MKKMVLLIAAVLTLGVSANSFAAWLTTTTDLGCSTLNLTNLKPSANVVLGYKPGGSGVAYTVGTYHSSGSFSYATSSGDTNVFRMPFTSGATPTEPPTAPTTAGAGADWTAWTAAK